MMTIKSKADFSLILSKGKKIVSNTHILFGMPLSDKGGSARVGFIVSKKLGNAVKRNRIKRRLKAVIQERINQHNKLDYIIIGRKKVLESTFDQLNYDVESSIKKINNIYHKEFI